MEYRTHVIFSGHSFEVPKNIVRLDSNSTHGWQLRYGEWTLYSDHTDDGSGAAAALKAATAELARRINKLPAPTGLKKVAMAGKANGMPLGVSGPIVRRRDGLRSAQFYLQVNFPVFSAKPANRSVYIATENTLTPEKYQAALNKAMALRETGVRKFKLATTKAKREQVGASSVSNVSNVSNVSSGSSVSRVSRVSSRSSGLRF